MVTDRREQLCLDQQRAVSICWRQMFVSVAFWKTSVQAKTAEFCIFTTYHLLARCPSLGFVSYIFWSTDEFGAYWNNWCLQDIHGFQKMCWKSQTSLGTLISSGTPDPGGQAVHEGDRRDIKADETGVRSDGGEEAANEDADETEEKALTLSASGHTPGCFRLSFRRFLISSRASCAFVFE